MGNVLMIDANQALDVLEAIDYVKGLFIKGSTAPDKHVQPLYLSTAFVPHLPPIVYSPHH